MGLSRDNSSRIRYVLRGHMFMESNQIDFWDNIWKTKELFSIEDYDFGEFSVFIDRIIKRNIIGKNILDLGCGR